MPTVSVVIPTYNRPKLLKRAIASVLNQTYQDFEIIVVDDCSHEDYTEVRDSFTDSRIHFLRHPSNRGLPASRNTGIKQAAGEFIAILDDDDEWLPEKLKKQVDKMLSSSPKVGVVYCGKITVLGESGKAVFKRPPKHRGRIFYWALKYNIFGCGSTPLFRKSCLKEVGYFDEEFKDYGYEDWDLAIRLAKIYEFDFVDEFLVKRYLHGAQMTGVVAGKIQAREIILKKYQEDLIKYPAVIADHLNRLGILYALVGSFKRAKEYFLRSVAMRPLQGFAYMHLFPVFFTPGFYRRFLERDIARKSIEGMNIYW